MLLDMLVFLFTEPKGLFSQMNFLFYCDGGDHGKPPGNKCCEGSLAKKVVNIGNAPPFQYCGLNWFSQEAQGTSPGNTHCSDLPGNLKNRPNRSLSGNNHPGHLMAMLLDGQPNISERWVNTLP